MTTVIGANKNKKFELLPTNFNRKKFSIVYGVPHNELLYQMQHAAKRQCMSNKLWPQIDAVDAWMISA